MTRLFSQIYFAVAVALTVVTAIMIGVMSHVTTQYQELAVMAARIPPWLPATLSFAASAVAVFLTTLPIHRRLVQLGRVADAIGRGDLDARAHLTGNGPIDLLGQRIDRMATRIQSVLSSKEELLQAVAHELRTPVSRVMAATHLARTADHQRCVQLLDDIDRSALDLSELVSELLDFCRLSDGAAGLETEHVSIHRVLHDAIQRTGDPRIQIDFDDTESVEVACDRRDLERALGNLIENAGRYANDCIRIRICHRSPEVTFVIEDDGPGLPLHERERVFEPFVRLDPSRDRETGGSGLGLAIVRRIASRHGGTVCVEKSILGGARFVFSLPKVTDSSLPR